jgi:hypothetical protein
MQFIYLLNKNITKKFMFLLKYIKYSYPYNFKLLLPNSSNIISLSHCKKFFGNFSNMIRDFKDNL